MKNLRLTYCPLISILVTSSYGAHWTLSTVGDSTTATTTSGSDATRSRRTTVQVSVSGVNGSGHLKFYGESDSFSKFVPGISPFTNFYNGFVNAYYTFVYKWTADLPGDVPPNPNQNVAANGYYLALNTVSNEGLHGGPGINENYGPATISSTFTGVAGGVFASSGGSPTQFNSFQGDPWPSSPSSSTVSVNNALFEVLPATVGSALISSDGKTATINAAENSQMVIFNGANWVPVDGQTGIPTNCLCTIGTTCFIGASSIANIPVTG